MISQVYSFIKLFVSICEPIFVMFGLLFSFGIGCYLGNKAALIFKRDK